MAPLGHDELILYYLEVRITGLETYYQPMQGITIETGLPVGIHGFN